MRRAQERAHILRRAQIEDIPGIMDFLDQFWERGCLLSRDRAFFEYEHVLDGQVSFIIAEHRETRAVEGVAGWLPCTRAQTEDCFGVMWVVKPRSGTPGLGNALGDFRDGLLDGEKPFMQAAYAVGLRKETSVPIIEMAGGLVGSMQHYYRLNAEADYKIAHIRQKKIAACAGGKKLIPLPSSEWLWRFFDPTWFQIARPHKDAWYVEHRYFRHPYFRFNIWGIEGVPGRMQGALVGRVVEQDGARVLRIVDFFGPDEALFGIGPELDLIMRANGIEYTDFYCAGLAQGALGAAGFALKDDDDPNIIPDFFEPFLQKNVEILYQAPPDTPPFRLFKGDADQGRPKRLRLPMEYRI